jgi:hypothetical protein
MYGTEDISKLSIYVGRPEDTREVTASWQEFENI